jgi:hypothetical protein
MATATARASAVRETPDNAEVPKYRYRDSNCVANAVTPVFIRVFRSIHQLGELGAAGGSPKPVTMPPKCPQPCPQFSGRIWSLTGPGPVWMGVGPLGTARLAADNSGHRRPWPISGTGTPVGRVARSNRSVPLAGGPARVSNDGSVALRRDGPRLRSGNEWGVCGARS